MPKLTAVLLACGAALAVAGCGTGGIDHATGDVQNGAKLFTAKCAGCHALAAAGSTATVGPDLDGAFAGDRNQGFSQSAILNVVLDQMRLPNLPMPPPATLFPVCKGGKSDRPAGCVKDRSAALADVAAYVASTAGVNGAEPKAPAAGSTNGKAIFKGNCASCHTLAAAGATGTIGPNLDQLKPPLARVKRQVIRGGGVMPAFKGKLSDKQIDAVAKFVASNAGK
ncbi:MAG: c-type cytochrome [Gaiellaceae bacterium]